MFNYIYFQFLLHLFHCIIFYQNGYQIKEFTTYNINFEANNSETYHNYLIVNQLT